MKRAGCFLLIAGLGMFVAGVFFSTRAVAGVDSVKFGDSLVIASHDAQWGVWLIYSALGSGILGFILLVIAWMKRPQTSAQQKGG